MESIRSGIVWLSFITLAAVSSLSFVPDETWDSFPAALGPARTFLADCRIAPEKYKSAKEPQSDVALVDPGPRELIEKSLENEAPYESSTRSHVRIGGHAVKNSQPDHDLAPNSEEPREPIGAPVEPTFAGHATVETHANGPDFEQHVAPTDDIFTDDQFDRDSLVVRDAAQSLAPANSPASLSDADILLGENADPRSIDERLAETDEPQSDVNVVTPMPEQIATDGVTAPFPTIPTTPEPAPSPVQPPAALPPTTAQNLSAVSDPTVGAAPQAPVDAAAVSNAVVDTSSAQNPAQQPAPVQPVFTDPLASQAPRQPLADQAPMSLPPQGTLPAQTSEAAAPQGVVPLAQTQTLPGCNQVSCSSLLAQGDAEGSLNAALESAKNIESAEQGREVFVTLNQLRAVYIRNNRLDVVNRINEVLDRLAFEVFYNPERAILEPLRQTQAGETLSSIARECDVTPETLAAINGMSISSDSPLPPGTTLKVVRGPVTAEVSSSRKELLLKFNNLYAGRFPCGVPQQAATLRGEYVVENKIENPECQAVDMTGARIMIEGGSPDNPLGSCWIGLNGGYGLQGTNRKELVGKDVPENGGFVFSNLHISQLDLLLPVGSSIYFTD